MKTRRSLAFHVGRARALEDHAFDRAQDIGRGLRMAVATPRLAISEGTSPNPGRASEAPATLPAKSENEVSPTQQNSSPVPSADVPPGKVEPQALAAIRDEIENVQFAVRDYRTTLGENPVGNNAEITRALLGDNPKQVKIAIPAGSTLNGEGQMCDRWGTPYFFHQMSAKGMEVRSAGADREMWSADDVVVR